VSPQVDRERGGTPDVTIRHVEPSDHAPITAVVDAWWGGRQMAGMLPPLFFAHFRPTSFVAERDGRLAGFLIGFVSQTDPAQAYIHFVGVDPEIRGAGLGRTLYERFFAAVHDRGCTEVRCVTSPVNTGSIAFHRAMGFSPFPGDATTPDGVPFARDYDGPGEDRVRFTKHL
jgi:predicted GNAT superfamily acetyltransferase